MRRSIALAIVVLITSLPATAQQAGAGRVRDQRAAAKSVRPTSNSLTVVFQTTPVNSTSIEECYFNCFFLFGSPEASCNSSGTVSSVKSPSPPFRVTNLRRAPVGSCGGTPVSLPVTLQAGEQLLQDFVFSPTSPGSFEDTVDYNLTPIGSQTFLFSWILSGSTPAAPPRIISFGGVPATARPGQQVTLSWTTSGATS